MVRDQLANQVGPDRQFCGSEIHSERVSGGARTCRVHCLFLTFASKVEQPGQILAIWHPHPLRLDLVKEGVTHGLNGTQPCLGSVLEQFSNEIDGLGRRARAENLCRGGGGVSNDVNDWNTLHGARQTRGPSQLKKKHNALALLNG